MDFRGFGARRSLGAHEHRGRGRWLKRAREQQGFAMKLQFAFPRNCQLSAGKNTLKGFSDPQLEHIFPSNIHCLTHSLHSWAAPGQKRGAGGRRNLGVAHQVSSRSCPFPDRRVHGGRYSFIPFSRHKALFQDFGLVCLVFFFLLGIYFSEGFSFKNRQVKSTGEKSREWVLAANVGALTFSKVTSFFFHLFL